MARGLGANVVVGLEKYQPEPGAYGGSSGGQNSPASCPSLNVTFKRLLVLSSMVKHKVRSCFSDVAISTKASMIHNSYVPHIELDPQTYIVKADGVPLVCEPDHENNDTNPLQFVVEHDDYLSDNTHEPITADRHYTRLKLALLHLLKL